VFKRKIPGIGCAGQGHSVLTSRTVAVPSWQKVALRLGNTSPVPGDTGISRSLPLYLRYVTIVTEEGVPTVAQPFDTSTKELIEAEEE
jgi:hypothetical protein